MGRFIIITILIFCLISSIYNIDCGTPVECYSKAVGVLSQDRVEMRRQMDKYQTLYESVLKENENLKASIQTLQSSLEGKLEETKKYSDRPYKIISAKLYQAGFLSTNLSTFPLNGIVAAGSKKVLVFISYMSGEGYEAHGQINLFTKVNGQMSRRSLGVSCYKQSAYDQNSSVFEMDLDGNDYNLYYSSDFNYNGGHFNFKIEILGFK
jgi:hypothetical protein